MRVARGCARARAACRRTRGTAAPADRRRASPGSRLRSIASTLRFSKCSTMSLSRVTAQATPPSRKPKLRLGKAPRHAAEEQRAAEELGAVGEVAEVVEDVVAGRGAIADAARGGVADRRHLELDAFAPERIVVVGRIHRDRARRLRRMQERVLARRRAARVRAARCRS